MSNNTDFYKEENEVLKEELRRILVLLESSQVEKNEIGVKYQLLSKRLEEVLQLQIDELESDDNYQLELNRHKIEWKNELVDELSHCRDRLAQCHQEQSKQAKVIQGLQQKVEEYREKCALVEREHSERSKLELKMSLDEKDASPSNVFGTDYENVTVQLVEERNRSKSLTEVNSILREQLEVATNANQVLTSDIHRLTREWQKTRQELDEKESQWREEEQSFNEYFTKEHHQLLTLWHHIMQFRQDFSELRTLTERDLGSLRTHLRQTTHNATNACFTLYANAPLQVTDPASWEIQRKTHENANLKHKFNVEKDELVEKIRDLTLQNERKKSLIEEKDKVITALNKTVETLEGLRSEPIESPASAKLKQDLSYATGVLRSIAQLIIDDSDQQIHSQQLRHILSSTNTDSSESNASTPSNALVPRTSDTLFNVSILGETTLSAVNAALRKKKIQLEELGTKLASTQEQIKAHKKALEECEEEKRNAQRKNTQLSSRIELVVQEIQNSMRDKDRIRSALDETGSERSLLEHTRQILNEQVETLNAENDRLYAKLRENQEKLENVLSERDTLKFQEKHLESELRTCNQRVSKLNEEGMKQSSEIRSLTNSINRISFEKDLLLREKIEFEKRIEGLETSNRQLRSENRVFSEENDSLNETLQSIRNENEFLSREKAENLTNINMLKEEKTQLNRDKAESEREKQKLKAKISNLEQRENEQNSKIINLQENQEQADILRQQLENENNKLLRLKEELEVLLTMANHQKDTVTEELVEIKKDVTSLRESCQRLERDKEALAMEKADLEVRHRALESELNECVETINSLRNEKERLETALYMSNQTVATLEQKKDELEHEINELSIKEASLVDEISKSSKQREVDLAVHTKTKELLGQKVQELQEEFKKSLKQEEDKRRNEVEKLTKEKVEIENRLRTEQSNSQLVWEEKLDETIKNHEKELEITQKEAKNALNVMEERLIRLEMEKKQIESLSTKEYNVFEQKLTSLKKELNEKDEEIKVERQKTQDVIDREKHLQNEIRSQLENAKTELENAVSAYNKELKDLRNQLIELQSQRDNFSQSCVTLKSQVTHLEETRDELKLLLSQAERQNKELTMQHENIRSESLVNEKWLLEEKLERENVSLECQELRMKIKNYEANKIEMNKTIDYLKQTLTNSQDALTSLTTECSELKKTLREVEQSRMELKRDLQQSHKQIMAFKNDLSVKDEDVTNQRELQKQSEQREIELRKEAASIKQSLLESEANRETLRKELANMQRKMTDLEHRMRLQKETHKAALEQSFSAERRLEEQKNGLEKSLSHCNEQLHELTLRLRSAEGRIYATEKNYNKSELNKQEIESKYVTLQNILRQTLGIGMEGSRWAPFYSRQSSPMRQEAVVNNTDNKSSKGSSSPRRGDSRSKSNSPARQLVVTSSSWALTAVSELDIDLVQSALEDLIQKTHSLEREQEEWKRKYQTSQRNLEDTKDEKETLQIRFEHLQKTLTEIENEKQNLGAELSTTRANLSQQEERVQQLEKDRDSLSEKILALQNNLNSAEKAKKYHQDKVTQLKTAIASNDKEKRDLEETKRKSESQTTTYELKIQMLEANIERCQMMLSEKSAENQLLEDQLSTSNKRVDRLEEKVVTLQRTIDHLMQELRISQENERDLKDKLHYANRSINESSSSSVNIQEHNRKLKQDYNRLENEKETLQRSLQEQKNSTTALKQECQYLKEKVEKLQKDLSTSESKRIEIETLTKSASKNVSKREHSERIIMGEISESREERKMLRDEIERLRQSLSISESLKIQLEKSRAKLEKENQSLQKMLELSEKHRVNEDFSSLTTTTTTNKSKLERTELGKSLSIIENENLELQRKVQNLQAKLAELEQHHNQRLRELTNLQHREVAMELERARTSQLQAEQLLEAREKTNRHRILGLEQQIATLKDQLAEEHRRWSRFHQRHLAADSEISQLRSILDRSLQTVSEDPSTLENEARRLDTTVESHIIRSPSITLTTPSKLSRTSPLTFGGVSTVQSTPAPTSGTGTSMSEGRQQSSGVRRRLEPSFD